jgi:hypothetical protein
MENMSFADLGLLLGVIEMWVVVMGHLHLLCEFSHTLYFTLTCNVEFVRVLT